MITGIVITVSAGIAGALISLLGAGVPVDGHTAHPAGRGEVILPRTLLGARQDTSREARVTDREVVAKVKAGAPDDTSGIAVAFYGHATGRWFLAEGLGTCGGCTPLPARQFLLEVDRTLGAAASARVFPAGHNGGVLVCGWDRTGPPVPAVHCYWADWRTAGQVIYADGFASSLADAAAKTNQIRAAAER